MEGTARRSRDRRGRGPRGPGVVPATPGSPATPTARERFDRVVLGAVASVEERWSHRLGLVEYAVEEAPLLPDDWGERPVPLGSLVRGSGSRPTQVVVFRRPVERRARGRAELEALVLAVVVEQVAELLGISPEEVDERYGPD